MMNGYVKDAAQILAKIVFRYLSGPYRVAKLEEAQREGKQAKREREDYVDKRLNVIDGKLDVIVGQSHTHERR